MRQRHAGITDAKLSPEAGHCDVKVCGDDEGRRWEPRLRRVLGCLRRQVVVQL